MAGLDTVPRENWPPVADHVLVVPHHGRHGIADGGAWPAQPVDALARQALRLAPAASCSRSRWAPAGFIAVLAGWITTETGRQPFTVYGLLRTADSASPLAAPAVASSLIAFIIVYFAVFTAGVIYILRLMAQPPHHGEQGPTQRRPCPRRRHHAGRRRRPREPSDEHRRSTCHHLGLHHRLCGVRLCRDGRLRSRARHPVPAVSRRRRSRRHHEQRRAGVGRQRDLAGARRRRHDGGVSAGLCRADAGALHADDRDAARPGVPRRRLRIPLAHHRASATAGTSPLPAARCWRRWRRASRSAPSCRASMSRAGIMPAAGGTG